MLSRLQPSLRVICALVVLAAGSTPAAAQYFGRNKVQYETFDFRILKTPHFDVYFYPEEEVAARHAARMAERWYARLSRILDHRFDERQPMVFYGSHPAFQQTVTTGGELSEGTGGFTEAFKQRVVMPLTGSYQETDHVLGHELVHAFQYDISGLGRAQGGLEAAARRYNVPLWFSEGMAEYLSGGPVDANAAMVVREGALSGRIPSIDQLTRDPRFFPYTWGHAFWAYVGGRWGDAVIGQILKLVGQGVPYEEAFQRILNQPLEEIGEDWAAAIRRAYLPLLADRPEAREIARPLITERKEGGRINIGPAVSPDGKLVAFLSSLGDFDIEVFLANAETGEVLRRLVKGTAFNSHFQSLRYINSAGTWSPDSRQFAFAALRKGQDVIAIVDATRGGIVREIDIPDVTEITTPTWSPDGSTIVFAGIEGGISDLYAYDLRTRQTRRLTQDIYANLHPSYSPDGRRIAFVTDQGAGTNLGTLQFGGYRIAVLDPSTGQTRILPQMEGQPNANNINPVWNREGTGIYFVSDRTGIPNVYRLDLQSEQLFQITRLFGGVSGITDISPAISGARNADRLLFTSYEKGGYNIYSLTTPQELAGNPVPADFAAGPPLPALLPPVPRPTDAPFNRVAALVEDPGYGLPTDTVYPVVPYRPRLGLDYLGQPQVGVSTRDAFGRGGVYGGISAIFSDVLGYHTLFGTIQAQGQLDEIGGSLTYLYRKHRWNYGVGVQRIPYIFLGQNVEVEGYNPNNPSQQQVLLRRQFQRYRIFDSSIQGIAQYPFSRNQRVEFSAGPRRVSQDVQVDEISGPAIVQGGRILAFTPAEQDRFEDERFGDATNLFETSAALVYDNAVFGYTSPFAGQRYRFEVSPTFGELEYIQALADYRRYVFLRPFTVALRGVHFGRYGRSAEANNILLRPIILGQPGLIRGYNYRDVYDECRETGQSCDLLDGLFGSRVLVANAELRFPLIRQIVVGTGIGLPPIEGIAFADAGVAYDKGSRPLFERATQSSVFNQGDRPFLTSAGVGARINLFGYFILEVDYVKPFARSEDWTWVFALQPGF